MSSARQLQLTQMRAVSGVRASSGSPVRVCWSESDEHFDLSARMHLSLRLKLNIFTISRSPKFVSAEMHGFAAKKLQDIEKCNVLSKLESLFDAAEAKKSNGITEGASAADLSELLNKVKLSPPQSSAKKHVSNRWTPSPGRW